MFFSSISQASTYCVFGCRCRSKLKMLQTLLWEWYLMLRTKDLSI